MYWKLTSSGKGWPVREAILDMLIIWGGDRLTGFALCFNFEKEALGFPGQTPPGRGAELLALKAGRARWRGLLSLIGKLSLVLARSCWTAPPRP
jgi:hypothetical protein